LHVNHDSQTKHCQDMSILNQNITRSFATTHSNHASSATNLQQQICSNKHAATNMQQQICSNRNAVAAAEAALFSVSQSQELHLSQDHITAHSSNKHCKKPV
jgi:hypothetical protein